MQVCSTPSDAGRVVVTIAIPSTAKAGEDYLVQRARSGDREAFESLVDVRLGSTFRTAMAILGNYDVRLLDDDEPSAFDSIGAVTAHS